MTELEEILENMTNGNWSVAIEQYKALNTTGREFTEFLFELDGEDTINFAILGFYSKETKC